MIRRRTAYLLFLLLSYLAYNYSGYEQLLPFFAFFLLLPLLSLLCLWLSMLAGALKAELNIVDEAGEAYSLRSVARGEGIELRLRLRMKAWLPAAAFKLWIRPFTSVIGLGSSPFVLLRFNGERVLDVFCRYHCPHRGHWALRAYKIEVWDLFGFFKLKLPGAQLPEAVRVAVCPLAAEIREPLLSAAENLLGQEVVKRFQGSEYEEVVDLRNYQPGDRPRQIHWGVSARTEIPQVFVYDDPRVTEIALLLLPPFTPELVEGESVAFALVEGEKAPPLLAADRVESALPLSFSEEELAADPALTGLAALPDTPKKKGRNFAEKTAGESLRTRRSSALARHLGADASGRFWSLSDAQADCAVAFLRLFRASGRLRSLFCLPAAAFDENQPLPNLLEIGGDLPKELGLLLACQLQEMTVAQLRLADEKAALAALEKVLPRSIRFCIVVTTYLSEALTERILGLAAEGRQILLTLIVAAGSSLGESAGDEFRTQGPRAKQEPAEPFNPEPLGAESAALEAETDLSATAAARRKRLRDAGIEVFLFRSELVPGLKLSEENKL